MGGPVGKIAGKDHAGMAASIKEFRATLHPVFRVEANHQASLVVEGGVLAVDASEESKIA